MKITSNQMAILNNDEFKATSDRYRPIKTIDVVNRFKEHGMTVSDMQESRTRDYNKIDKVRHFVRMTIDEQQGIRREVVIMNSSDSTTSLRLHAGFTRMVCLNGCVFSDDMIPAEKIKHTHHTPFARIDSFVERLMKSLDEEQRIRETMMNKRLSAYDIERFAYSAIATKEKDMSIILDPMAVAQIRRPEDQGKDLFTVYQRIQENIIKGGSYKKLSQYTDSETGEITEKYSVAKLISNHSRAIDINKNLHTLAMSYM